MRDRRKMPTTARVASASFAFGTWVLALMVTGLLIAGCGSASKEVKAPSNLSSVAAQGKQIADKKCMGCHTVDGGVSSGPTWQHLAGSQVRLTDGRTITVDDAYLAKSIEDPDGEIVSGYPRTMGIAIPKGSIKPEEVTALVAYINALR